jgi:hypothetical protein
MKVRFCECERAPGREGDGFLSGRPSEHDPSAMSVLAIGSSCERRRRQDLGSPTGRELAKVQSAVKAVLSVR